VARKAGAPLRGPRCGQQRRCTGAECGGSAAVRRAIVFLIHSICGMEEEICTQVTWECEARLRA
jgi:hypothetical protein